MNREETIKWLESLKAEIGKSEHRTLWHYAKSIDMAIEALSAELSSDLISRADVIRWVKTECNPYGKPTLDFESGKKVIEHLRHMADKPTGEWINHEDGITISCNKCNWWFDVGEEGLDTYNYCPNCGTRMENKK